MKTFWELSKQFQRNFWGLTENDARKQKLFVGPRMLSFLKYSSLGTFSSVSSCSLLSFRHNFVLVFVSLMVKFGYFICFDFTILRNCCRAKTRFRSRFVLTSWSIVFSFDALDRNIILWGYDKIPLTDPGWVSPWECEMVVSSTGCTGWPRLLLPPDSVKYDFIPFTFGQWSPTSLRLVELSAVFCMMKTIFSL